MLLDELGCDEATRKAFEAQARPNWVLARAALVQGEHGQLLYEDGELYAKLPRKVRLEGEHKVVVGDWLGVERPQGQVAIVRSILPRRSRFVRRAAGKRTELQVVAANVDELFIVNGADGDLSPRRMERYLTLAAEAGVQPVLCITKMLSVAPEAAMRARAALEEVAGDVPTLELDLPAGLGADAIDARLRPGLTVALVGSSGVGKSTLANHLLGEAKMATQEVREADSRGRHTTTHRQLLRLPSGACIIDTPGMRELQLWAEQEDLDETFDEIEELARRCRFGDCRHGEEPGCAVREGLSADRISPKRFEAYMKLRDELEATARRRDERARRSHERAGSKMIRRVQKHQRRNKGN